MFVSSMMFVCPVSMSHPVFLVSRHPTLCALASCSNMTHHPTHHHHTRNALYACEKTHISHDSPNTPDHHTNIMTPEDTQQHLTTIPTNHDSRKTHNTPDHHTNNEKHPFPASPFIFQPPDLPTPEYNVFRSLLFFSAP